MRTSSEKALPTVEQVAADFQTGFDCSQVVADYFAEEMGLSVEEARKVSACFGGGCGRGGTCGAVVGAMMVLGMKYGQYDADHMEQKEVMAQKQGAFFDAFSKEYGSSLCRDLLGHDISQPGEFDKVVEEGTMMTLCPRIVRDTIRMTETILKED
ncbi:MAG: C_GCAxxG_C_C family protein [Clostridia bacterium]|nr:C_GCAxxG_C_C family protein [Clostridia bacterium]